MKRGDVLSGLQLAAKEILDIDPSKIREDTVLSDDLDVDSLDLMDVAMTLEKDYDIEFDEKELRSVSTAGDVVDLILSKVGATGHVDA